MRNMHIHPKDAVLPNGLTMSGNVFRRNIVYYCDPTPNCSAFTTSPGQNTSPITTSSTTLACPCRRGRWWRCKGGMLDPWASWQAMGFDKHSLVTDPQFVDPGKDDYRLKPTSPAWRLGFKPIPVEKIGPYRDDLRATWPILEAEGIRERPYRPKTADNR